MSYWFVGFFFNSVYIDTIVIQILDRNSDLRKSAVLLNLHHSSHLKYVAFL